MLTISRDYECVFWDFDGVLMDSNNVRTCAFRHSLENYPRSEVQELIIFHELNGGLSRYVKFDHFFNNILKVKPSKETLDECLRKFNDYCVSHLNDKKLLISETKEMVFRLSSLNIDQHITSGSDEEELNKLCNNLDIAKYFRTIKGSPVPKTENIKSVLMELGYDLKKCVMIGDSINDRDAAASNGISFIPFGNNDLLSI
jgi:phosphoglycolate phosphatase-like HAD superfamily hydrolase